MKINKAGSSNPTDAVAKGGVKVQGKTLKVKPNAGDSEEIPFGSIGEPPLPRSSLVVWILSLLLLCLLAWAWYFKLDEVSTGTGKVVPSAKEQVIQSLEGGILVDLRVREGDLVEAGQVLAQLDRTKTQSTVNESASKLRAALAMSARLNAEVNSLPLNFPPEVREEPDLLQSEALLYKSRREGLNSAFESHRVWWRLVC